MECDLILTWKMDKLAYSSQDIKQTIHLVWTNLSTDELKEPFTASVKVGNEKDGYTTVWSQRIIKNQEFELPSEEKILEMLNYANYDLAGFGNMKYSDVGGYTLDNTTGLKISRDTDYYFEVTPRIYTLIVDGVKNSDASTKSQKFTAKYGEKFDLSPLQNTGENNDSTKSYSTFFNVTGENNGKALDRNFNEEINRSFAKELIDINTDYKANYVDNSVSVNYKFVGAELETETLKIKKGTVPPETYIKDLMLQGKMVKSISPAMGPVNTTTTFTVYCEETNAPKYTITYQTNGGSTITTGTYFEGSAISAPSEPTKEGYIFDGWYSDEQLTTPYTFVTMQGNDITIFAKWKGSEYTVTFDSREGILEGENTKTVIFGEKYGDLPNVTRPGNVFNGWYTEPSGGTKITADSVYNTVGAQKLYAQWSAKQIIAKNEVTIENATATYDQQNHGVTYSHNTLNDFTVQYKEQNTDTWESTAVNAGTYDVRVTRAEDGKYQSFDETYIGVLKINKAVREINTESIVVNNKTFTTLDLSIDIPDNRGDIIFYHKVLPIGSLYNPTKYDKSNNRVILDNLYIQTTYRIDVAVKNDPNYYDAVSTVSRHISTIAKPTTSWADYADTSWFNSNSRSAEIRTAEQLAGLAKLVNDGVTDFKDWNITIFNNEINLNAHKWIPIGNKETTKFRGNISGWGRATISGMYCENTGFGGFIGALDSGRVESISITDGYITDGTQNPETSMITSGGVVAHANNSSILRCTNDAYIGAYPDGSYSGGIVGYAIDSGITYCQNNGTVKGLSAGGITSFFITPNNNSRITGCRNTGYVKGSYFVGGIVGYNDSKNGYIGVINCINEGSVEGSSSVGGVCGLNESGNIVNSANLGSVSGSDQVGGVLGTNNGKTSFVYNCYSTGSVTGSNYVGGVVGRNVKDDGKVLNCYYLQGSATDDGSAVNGAGKNKGSVADDHDNLNLASFTGPDSELSRDAGYGNKDLLTALNKWVGTQYTGVEYWKQAKDCYPDIPNSGLKTSRTSLQYSKVWKKLPDEIDLLPDDTEEE